MSEDYRKHGVGSRFILPLSPYDWGRPAAAKREAEDEPDRDLDERIRRIVRQEYNKRAGLPNDYEG